MNQGTATSMIVFLCGEPKGNDLLETGSTPPASTSACQHRMTEIQRGTNRGVRSFVCHGGIVAHVSVVCL